MGHNPSTNWKVDYTTFSGARSVIIVLAESSDEAKRITAAMTYTDPKDVHCACCVDINERAPSPYQWTKRSSIATLALSDALSSGQSGEAAQAVML